MFHRDIFCTYGRTGYWKSGCLDVEKRDCTNKNKNNPWYGACCDWIDGQCQSKKPDVNIVPLNLGKNKKCIQLGMINLNPEFFFSSFLAL